MRQRWSSASSKALPPTRRRFKPASQHGRQRGTKFYSTRCCALRRKEKRARLAGTPFVDPRLFPRRAPAGDELLRGMPGSPGVAEGPARIVRDDSEFDKLVAGEVLVAPYTNPSWTPLFQRAVAVVVDSGSPASHAAIVAREYGIPAVMSTVTGTQTVREGERIRVDGSHGAVFRVTPQQNRRQNAGDING
jgi:pyruvate,water dikinase